MERPDGTRAPLHGQDPPEDKNQTEHHEFLQQIRISVIPSLGNAATIFEERVVRISYGNRRRM